ncbi:hypothetical protein [Raineyella sp. W15-4]|uniref:hypothetical protein n=1 Tax=Raineyella sp. W15-4 TaxID=3081651 RepID=UPI0029559687|nr:hypothetical protein [Raineyella sp. W15-4]WOQ16447.1 hypothetical protein R0145_14765 [Raineyella sp. W15-4]
MNLGTINVRSALRSVGSMVGGAALAVIPATTLSIASRLYDTQAQGIISTFVMAGTFLGQLSFAIIVESRLSTPGTARRVVFPRWFVLAGVVASVALMAGSLHPALVCVSIPIVLAALEVGRGVSVAERRDSQEIISSFAVGLGALAGLALAYTGLAAFGFVPVGAAIGVATLVRARRMDHAASSSDPSIRNWVLLDTAITGVSYPVINAMLLGLIGPAQAVLFTAVSTVTGLLAIPLTFMRLRLLKEHSPLDIALAAVALVGAVAVLIVLDVTGLLGFLFGAAWRNTPMLLPLLAASAWRAASLPTTITFTSLRRAGRARLMTLLRAAAAVLTFGLAMAGVLSHQLTLVFVGLLIAELASAVLYEAAHRRVLGRSSFRAA